jgi:lactoylglutathione lyase
VKVKYATIIVRDMDESVSFYKDVMGFEIASEHRPAPSLMITLMESEGETMVELIHNPEYQAGLYSIGMEVEDINEKVEQLKARGVKITMDPVPITVGFLAFCEDPNGVRIALIQHSGGPDAGH